MVDVNIDVEDPLVFFQKLQNCENAIIDAAESGRLGSLGMMKAPSPIDGHITSAAVEPMCSLERPARGYLAELPQPVENQAIEITDVE